MATLSTYTALCQNEVDDTSTRAKNVIERAVKDAYQEILNFNVEYLVGTTEEDITATASQRYVTPTNTYQDIKEVLYKPAGGSNFDYLRRMEQREYYQIDINRETGTPRSYYLNGNNIYFDIAPSDAGTVRVSGVEVQDELSGSTESIIPDRFSQVVVKGAVAHFKAYEGLQDAREYFKIYRGPYFEQGKIGGSLEWMLEQVNTRQRPKRLKIYGR
jgi:hypothetical protein